MTAEARGGQPTDGLAPHGQPFACRLGRVGVEPVEGDVGEGGGDGSADLTFDHAGERAVTGGGAVVGQLAPLAQQPALI